MKIDKKEFCYFLDTADLKIKNHIKNVILDLQKIKKNHIEAIIKEANSFSKEELKEKLISTKIEKETSKYDIIIKRIEDFRLNK